MDVVDDNQTGAGAEPATSLDNKERWCEPEIIDLPPLTDVTLQSPIGCVFDPVTKTIICGDAEGRSRPPMMP